MVYVVSCRWKEYRMHTMYRVCGDAYIIIITVDDFDILL
jgi:hypothetical protein